VVERLARVINQGGKGFPKIPKYLLEIGVGLVEKRNNEKE
jgi:hypothetical protein